MNLSDKTYLFYINQINKVKLLTRSEEYDLAVKASRGDNKAKQMLILANLRFVIKIARRYSNCGLSTMDLISEGNMGLLRAVETFDPDKGYHFISYAVHWIKQSIIKAISEKSKIIKIPLHLNNSYTRINKKLSQEYKDELTAQTVEDISQKMEMRKNDLAKLISISNGYTSLDQHLDTTEKKSTKQLKDVIKDNSETDPETAVLKQSLKKNIKNIISKLDQIETEVIKYRFGLDNYPPLTLQEIGKLKNVTKERIRQIEKKALSKLKKLKESNALSNYLQS